MKCTASPRLALVPVIATLLPACVYAPVMPQTYAFDRHPGVVLEVGWRYNLDGSGYAVTNLVNRSTVDKCAWSDAFDSRLLRAGETLQVGQVQSPGNVGVANVLPWDPNCVNARREHR